MEFKICERQIKCTDDTLIGDNADYVANFEFDEEWDALVKTVRFESKFGYFDILLENDKCIIPVEILKKGFIRVGVFSDKMTTTPAEIFVRESIKEKNGSPLSPSEDVYTQIIKMLEDITVKGITDEQLGFAIAEYLNEHPIAAGITIEDVEQFFNANKSELKGEDYVITESDYNNIADVVLNKLQDAESVAL